MIGLDNSAGFGPAECKKKLAAVAGIPHNEDCLFGNDTHSRICMRKLIGRVQNHLSKFRAVWEDGGMRWDGREWEDGIGQFSSVGRAVFIIIGGRNQQKLSVAIKSVFNSYSKTTSTAEYVDAAIILHPERIRRIPVS